MEIYKKIAKAKKEIKQTKMKKKGRNDFSKYDYFTPDQVEQLVFEACDNNGLLTTFQLNRNEFGEYGILHIIEIETGEMQPFKMATAIPSIKATNIAQQLGGCMTYTERYLKMSAFGITDNSIDFDSKHVAPEPQVKEQATTVIVPNELQSEVLNGIAECKDLDSLTKYHDSVKNRIKPYQVLTKLFTAKKILLKKDLALA